MGESSTRHIADQDHRLHGLGPRQSLTTRRVEDGWITTLLPIPATVASPSHHRCHIGSDRHITRSTLHAQRMLTHPMTTLPAAATTLSHPNKDRQPTHGNPRRNTGHLILPQRLTSHSHPIADPLIHQAITDVTSLSTMLEASTTTPTHTYPSNLPQALPQDHQATVIHSTLPGAKGLAMSLVGSITGWYVCYINWLLFLNSQKLPCYNNNTANATHSLSFLSPPIFVSFLLSLSSYIRTHSCIILTPFHALF